MMKQLDGITRAFMVAKRIMAQVVSIGGIKIRANGLERVLNNLSFVVGLCDYKIIVIKVVLNGVSSFQ